MDGEQRQHFEELLHRYQQRLRVQEKRTATLGLNTPPEVEIEVQELRRQIADIEAKLTRSSKAIGQHINNIPISTQGNRQWAWLIYSSFGVCLLVLAFWLGNRLASLGSNVQQQPPTTGAMVLTVAPFSGGVTLITAPSSVNATLTAPPTSEPTLTLTPEPTTTPTIEPTTTPTVPLDYDRRLPQAIGNASLDENWPGTVQLAKDQPYKIRQCQVFTCYIDVWPPGAVWVSREQVGLPPATPTNTPMPRPPTNTLTPRPPTNTPILKVPSATNIAFDVGSNMLNPAFGWEPGTSGDSKYSFTSNPNELILITGANTGSLPMLLYPLDGDFEARVKVYIEPAKNYQNYQFAGIGVISARDSDTRIRISRGFYDGQIVGALFERTGEPLKSNSSPYTNSTIYLRIIKNGNNFTTSYSGNGVSWKELLNGEFDVGNNFNLMLFAFSTTEESISATFSDFTVDRKPGL